MLICDDDLKYDKNCILSYEKSLSIDKNIIYTHYNKTILFDGQKVNELQGADTFLLIPLFFELTSYSKYKEYLDITIKECPDSFYVDDKIIQFYLLIQCKLKILFTSIKSKVYTESFCINPLHLDSRAKARMNETYKYFIKIPTIL